METYECKCNNNFIEEAKKEKKIQSKMTVRNSSGARFSTRSVRKTGREKKRERQRERKRMNILELKNVNLFFLRIGL